VRLENVTPPKFDRMTYYSSRPTLSACRPEMIQFMDAAVRRVEFEVRLKAGNCYCVTVTALQLGSKILQVDNYCCIGAGETQFKAGLF